jgi:iron complex transport system substrate-binding protein
MRVVSLLPSATEIVCALGLSDALVGVSHECDYPAEVVRDLPRLTRSAIPAGPGVTSAEIDAAVAERLRQGAGLYDLDEACLADLKPDLVITQELCDVCAVSYTEVCRIAARLPGDPPVLSLQPADIAGILGDVRAVAGALGAPERGARLAEHLRARLAQAARPSLAAERPPRVFAMEWMDPPYAGGHWVPEMIELAGGRDVLGRAGQKSFRLTWEQVAAARPEIILVIPCGYTAAAAQAEFAAQPEPPGWGALPAVQSGRVHFLEANDFFSRPAPRVVDGVELLAGLFHQDK